MIYFPHIAPNIQNLTDDEVAVRLSEYDSAKVADDADRARGIRNMMVATGLNYDQWANNWALLQQMLEEGRGPTAMNFIQFYVRGLVGNFIMNWFDPKFIDNESIDRDVLDALAAMQKVYYANKEHYNYKESAINTIWNGVVYRGIEELIIDRSGPDPRGVVRFESVRPDMVVFDPGNISDHISRNARKAWKRFYLTYAEMVQHFPHMEGRIKDQIRALESMNSTEGEQFEEMQIGSFVDVDLNHYGSKQLCIEGYEIRWEKKAVAIHTETGRQFPDSGHEFGTEEDFLAKVLWGVDNGYDVTPETITTVERNVPILYTVTICRSLGLVLENRKDERQLGEHLPLYAWSFLEKNGKSIGAVDHLVDAQDDLNKRNNHATKVMTSTPIGGKTWIHPDAYGASEQRRQEMIENLTDSAEPLILDEDAPAGVNLFGIVSSPGVNQSLLQDESLKIEYMNKMASLPLAMQGITERSGESGLHLGRKVIEGSVMQRVPTESIVQHENDKAEDWLKIAVPLYRGPQNFNRVFTGGEDSKPVMINQDMGTDILGEPVLQNDVGRIDVDRVDVIVAMAKENDFLRQAKRETDASILQSIQPTATNGAAIAAFVTDLIESSDFSDQRQREKAIEAAKLYYDLEMSTGRAALATAQTQEIAATKGLQEAKKKAAQPPAPPAPPGGPGGPAPGGAPAGPAGGPPPPEPAPGQRMETASAEPIREGEPTR